jgi:hypothetical protein
MGEISIIDWVIWSVYLTLFLLLGYIYANHKKQPIYDYFIRGILIKVVGGVFFALIYVYYYGFGDTFLYHQGATVLSQTLLDSPLDYFRLLFSEADKLPPDLSYIQQSVAYADTFEEWFMVKLLSLINLISFQSYLVSTLFLSMIAFFGGWKLFQVFTAILPNKLNLSFIAVFLVPSVFFWGSGIMKDTITLAAINLVIYTLYFGFMRSRKRYGLVIIAVISIVIIVNLKAYIFLAFLPGLFMAVYVQFKQSLNNRIIRFVAAPLIFIGLIGLCIIGFSQATEVSAKYQVSNLEYKVKGFHSWHTDLGGSSYNLGEVEFTTVGILSKVPAALNVTYFRPYLWESRNPVVLLGALESTILFLLFLYVLYRANFKFIRMLKREPLLYGCLFFCLIFGFSVGFTSYNFGALARYKIPVMSLVTFMLIYVDFQVKQEHPHKTESSQ